MKFTQASTAKTHEIAVLFTRKAGNNFYAGKVSEADELGTEIKNREGYYPLVGNVQEGQEVIVTLRTQDGEEFQADIQGVSITMPVSESALEEMNTQGFNGLIVKGEFVVSSPRDLEGALAGSIWLEPVNEAELECGPSVAGVASKDRALELIAGNRKRNQDRRMELRAIAKAGGQAGAEAKDPTPDLVG